MMSLNNAKVFSTIDIAQAFLQLALDDNWKKYTVINTYLKDFFSIITYLLG